MSIEDKLRESSTKLEKIIKSFQDKDHIKVISVLSEFTLLSANEIEKKTGLEKEVVYSVLEDLIEYGLIKKGIRSEKVYLKQIFWNLTNI